MSQSFTIEAQAEMPVSAEIIFHILADYTTHHPAILPKQFEKITVIEGGYGDGTIIDISMKMFGSRRTSRAYITVAKPGRELVETIPESNLITTFIIDPIDEEKRCQLTLKTEGTFSRGLTGAIEKRMLPNFLRKLYEEELENLKQYSQTVTLEPDR